MVKLTYLVKRRPDLTNAAFCERWQALHAGLVDDYAETLNAQRYVMSRRLDTVCNTTVTDARNLAPSQYDGVIEIWWHSIGDYQAGAGSADGLKAIDAIIDAERRFIDFAGSQAFFTEEAVVFEQVCESLAIDNLTDSEVKLLKQ